VSGRALELRPEVVQDRLHPEGAQHCEFSGLRLDAEHKQKHDPDICCCDKCTSLHGILL
jgi:hypothetical protein